MKDFLTLQQKIVPEIIDLLERRYTILRTIAQHQPMGRRAIAAKLTVGERIVRGDLDLLKTQGLVGADQSGVSLTETGEEVIDELGQLLRLFWGLHELETAVAKALAIEQVIIVPGDSDGDGAVKGEIGRVAARLLLDGLADHNTIAISGGSTTLAVAEAIPVTPSVARKFASVMVLPARGGLGEELEEQANHIAAKLARRLAGEYRMLHVPDNLSPEAVEAMLKEPSIAELLDRIKAADVVIHGVGTADQMATRRGFSAEAMQSLTVAGAVGEALGYYFNGQGQVVLQTNSIGLRLEYLRHVKSVIAVAGGASKAQAIAAVVKGKAQLTLVTDEAAAKGILRIKV